MLAIGFIETKGLLPAIEGADAMLKAADVSLLEKNLVGGGLVTITVAGEVAAVQAAVDAAAACIARIAGAILVSRHVIPRPDAELSRILATAPLRASLSQADPGVFQQPEEEDAAQPGTAENALAEVEELSRTRLKKMSLQKLRQLAGKLEGVSLSEEGIAAASRHELIEAIANVVRHTKE